MGLKALIQSATATAFNALDDLPVTGTASYKNQKIFDSATQTNNWTYNTDSCEIIQYDFTAEEKLSEGVSEHDSKFLIQRSELTQDIEDYELIVVGSETWDIQNILLKESSESVVIYHVRLENV